MKYFAIIAPLLLTSSVFASEYNSHFFKCEVVTCTITCPKEVILDEVDETKTAELRLIYPDNSSVDYGVGPFEYSWTSEPMSKYLEGQWDNGVSFSLRQRETYDLSGAINIGEDGTLGVSCLEINVSANSR